MPEALLIGLSGLETQRRAMEVTSHNIANASTPGYSRQSMVISPKTPEEKPKPGTVGRGVEADAIIREVDELLIERFRKSFTELGRLETLATTLDDLELVYNEPGDGGFANVINSTFAALEDLSNNPESIAMRTGAVQQMQTFTSTLRLMYDRLTGMREDLKVQMDAELKQVNLLTSQISALNQDIKRLVLSDRSPNDLLDQRDRLINQLSERMEVRVLTNSTDKTVRIDLKGATLVSGNDYSTVERSTDAYGNMIVVFEGGGNRADPGSGILGAAEELSGEILPAAIEQMNDMISTLIQQINSAHATGLSHTYQMEGHAAEVNLDPSNLLVNLDDSRQARDEINKFGIYEGFLPSYTDEDGTAVARNLTLNVYNTEDDVAQKYTIRYEPGAGTPASRSMADLVAAINTGVGGGYTVHPPRPGGITGVTARAVSVSGGLNLQIEADSGYSIDFSQALDLEPVDQAWSGGQIDVVGADAAFADSRLNFRVRAGGTELFAFRNDPINGSEITVGTVDLTNPAGSAALTGGITVTYAVGGGYVDGQGFATSFTGSNVNHTQVANWTTGDAGFQITGRYTGKQSFEPSRRWGMQVLQGGVIGAASDALAPNNPPVVELRYWQGPAEAPQMRTIQVALDEDLVAGDQVRIADGVYAIFDSGTLTTGNNAEFTVDADPDQAGLLTALGINNLLSGADGQNVTVSNRILATPGMLAVSKTRSPGDNSNILEMIEVRSQELYGDGSTLDEFYQAQVSDAAVRRQQVTALQENQILLTQSLENRRDEISGVSIDEEVGMLILQQQAYTASARVITIAKENIDTLLNVVS